MANVPYYGVMIFSKKVCGADFMKAFGDGRLTYSVDDKVDMYCTKGQYSYYLNDGFRSKIALQFYSTGPPKANKGNGKNQVHLVKKQKHDLFMFALNGLDKVCFHIPSIRQLILSLLKKFLNFRCLNNS